MSDRPTIVDWLLVLGGVGFVLGFVGPMVLSPESNIGPIIGILITGPGGALAGLLLGALFRVLPVGSAVRRAALALAALAMAVVTLYLSLPEPATESYVIEATVESCERPTAALAEAVAEWQREVARVTWASAAPNWQAIAVGHVQRDDGLLLNVHVQRRSAILRHRRPWDGGRRSAGDWLVVDERQRYYGPADGGSCESYVQRGAALYWPAVDPNLDPMTPSNPWPPQDVLGFLGLQTLSPVPAEYRRLLP
jgi:hypothetical protein